MRRLVFAFVVRKTPKTSFAVTRPIHVWGSCQGAHLRYRNETIFPTASIPAANFGSIRQKVRKEMSFEETFVAILNLHFSGGIGATWNSDLLKLFHSDIQDVAQDVGHISHLEILHQTMPSPKPYEPKQGERVRIDKIVLTQFNYYDVNWRISRWLSWQSSWNSSNDISSKTICWIEPKLYGRDICKFSFAKIVTFR